MNRILLIEDDQTISQQLSEYLSKQSFKVTICASFTQALRADPNQFDLAVIDWNLGDGEGIDVVKQWRGKKHLIPIIMLTARTDVIDRVLGLELGAQDYVMKPYDPRELLARIRVHLRPTSGTEASNTFEASGVKVDLSAREVTFQSRAVDLTKMEFDLLLVLMRAAGKVFTREELLSRVWGFDSVAETRTVDAHIFKLRQKFGEDLIETVRGLGYRFKKSGS